MDRVELEAKSDHRWCKSVRLFHSSVGEHVLRQSFTSVKLLSVVHIDQPPLQFELLSSCMKENVYK